MSRAFINKKTPIFGAVEKCTKITVYPWNIRLNGACGAGRIQVNRTREESGFWLPDRMKNLMRPPHFFVVLTRKILRNVVKVRGRNAMLAADLVEDQRISGIQ